MNDTDIKMPPEVIHLSFVKGASHKEIIQDIINKFGLKSEEAKLLMLYGTCRNRFKPSRKYIEGKTGILKDNITRVRKKLVDHGFIELYKRKDGTSAIYIDWVQLRDLASIPKDMLGKKKNRYVAKVDHAWTPKYSYLDSKTLSDETKMMLFASDYWDIPLTKDCSEEDETFGMQDSFLEEKKKDAEEFFFGGGFEKEFPEVASMVLEPVPF